MHCSEHMNTESMFCFGVFCTNYIILFIVPLTTGSVVRLALLKTFHAPSVSRPEPDPSGTHHRERQPRIYGNGIAWVNQIKLVKMSKSWKTQEFSYDSTLHETHNLSELSFATCCKMSDKSSFILFVKIHQKSS